MTGARVHQAGDMIMIKCADRKQPFYGDTVTVVDPPQSLEAGQEMTVAHRGAHYRVELVAAKDGSVGWKVKP